MEFPQYRKYKNDQSYFKITSLEAFIEWKKNGNDWEQIQFQAKIFPDRQYIADMLDNPEPHWDVVVEADFEDFLKQQNRRD